MRPFLASKKFFFLFLSVGSFMCIAKLFVLSEGVFDGRQYESSLLPVPQWLRIQRSAHFSNPFTCLLFRDGGLSDQQSSNKTSQEQKTPKPWWDRSASLRRIKCTGRTKLDAWAFPSVVPSITSLHFVFEVQCHRIQLFFSTGAWREDKAEHMFEDK